MHGHILSPDAEYYRTQYYREVAHRRLVAQARTARDRQTVTGGRDRLGRVLAAVGTRLQGTPEPAPLVDPATTGRAGS